MAGQLPSSEEEVQALLQSAVLERASHIRKEAETITMANVRRLLESDLGLENLALDGHKAFIRGLVDEVLANPDDAQPEREEAPSEEAPSEEAPSEEAPKHIKKKKKKREENGSVNETVENHTEGAGAEEYVESPKKKKQKQEIVRKGKASKQEEEEDEEESYVESPKKKKQKKETKKGKASKHQDEEDAENVSQGYVSSEECDEEMPKEKSKKIKGRKQKEEIHSEDENVDQSQSEMSEENSDASERKKPKKGSSKAASFKPVQNKKVEHLKKVIKACGLAIPPHIYKRAKQQPEDKYDKFLIKELEDILSRRGLSTDPSEKEIKAAKRKLAREKDLEGIDTTNIIMEPRGRRAASQSFAPVYKPPPPEYDSDINDEGEEDEEEESDNVTDDSEDEKHSGAADDTDNSD